MTEKFDITCVYCGHKYPEQTPAHGSKILTDHIKICEKHPMREAEQKIELLKNALIGLVGSDEPETLKEMEAALRTMPVPDEDKAATINAIHAILKTI